MARLRSFWDGLTGLGTATERGKSVAADELIPASPVSESCGGFEELTQEFDANVGDAIDLAFGSRSVLRDVEVSAIDHGPQELFASIAATYSQPVKDFVHDLRRGTAKSDWIEICTPVLDSIIYGARSLDLHDAAARMVAFRDLLARVGPPNGDLVSGEVRKQILESYEDLVQVLPKTFELEDGADHRDRDGILLHSLLRQIPEVGHVTLKKLYGAGLTSLEALFLATAPDISTTTGVPEWLCERICGKVQEYRRQIDGAVAGRPVADCRERLAEIVAELQRHQAHLEKITRETNADGSPEKRMCLRHRQDCALRINVLLVEMEELGLVEELRKLAVARRIERLERYLGSEATTTTNTKERTHSNSAGNR